MPENSQNGKTTARPVTVPTHQESERKVYFKVGPMGKKAFFGQKMPKKCHFAILRAPNGKILQI